jgi:energy-coupling factor transporter ATP-binding protein EcfA2
LKGLTQSYPIINDDGLDLNIKKGHKLNISKKEDLINYQSAIENIDANFHKIIPNQIIESEVITKFREAIKYAVILESNIYNERLIKNKHTINKLIDNYFDYKDNKTEKSKNKNEHSTLIANKLRYLSQDYIYRSSIVNAFIKATKGFKEKVAHYKTMHGSKRNRFIFSKELEIQNPIDYFMKCIEKHFDKNKLKKADIEIEISNFPKLAEVFVGNPEIYLKESTTLKDLIVAIEGFNLIYTPKSSIYYVDDEGGIRNIRQLSPGYQTNILMEYIVYRETEKPLLIDQPEDNVDNQTIYTQLKEWFMSLKFKRQVIVVTHDANIVINSDAENVIIANQEEENKFKYEHGALEFEEIIEKAAIILDGGIDAVQRRLTKYES